ncbi:hypothetical protein AGABI2DRAFT_118490 [Agaricus bisporus var. bisporus H97]|uniref:hypothetical protein n=1 Tax=Agaricus bisporus var. bisporus (strain H97 / ATCC MYA-4626 / FGSC 10389) TaxID=936046 RepID=UPI00029F4FF9|nr:hypothetical protein AGABI2DRAFT_118490 [Agaricus bisporus var. bisporus H97]EKV46297.1 hypothetical protein AGABI2DRAFT_118490 [Agaricus bisporus var. bisporus H97]
MKPVVELPPLPAKYFKEEKKGPSYKQQAKIEEGISIEEMLEKFGETEIKLSQKELLGMAPKLREALKDLLSKRRVPTSNNNIVVDRDQEEEKLDWTYASLNKLGTVQKIQTEAKNKEGNPVKVWEVKEPLTQYLTAVPVEKRERLVFTIEKEESQSAETMHQEKCFFLNCS